MDDPSPGLRPGLFFVAGFSPGRHPFHTWRVVTDEAAYGRLVRDRNPQADPADRTATFPSYR